MNLGKPVAPSSSPLPGSVDRQVVFPTITQQPWLRGFDATF